MPAPTNISFLTATDLGTLPTTVTQQVDDAGTTYTVYYKFTAPSTGVAGIFAFGDLTTYEPDTLPYEGPASSPTSILGIQATNVPIQIPVTASTEYFLKILTNAGNPTPANLTLNVQMAPATTAPLGSIAVNDASPFFPLALLSATSDDTVLTFILDFAAGEAGDTFLDGSVVVENIDTNTYDFYTFDPSTIYTRVSQTPQLSALNALRTCLGANVMYLGEGGSPATYRTITAAGVFSAPVNLTGTTTIRSIAASNDETILYYADVSTGAVIKRWDIPGGSALSNFVAGVANYQPHDILVLSDETVIVGYVKPSGGNDYKVIAYDAAGTTLHTYNYGVWALSRPRLAYALDDPNSFWVFINLGGASTGLAHFINTKVSDGSALTTREQTVYSFGVYDGTATATPTGRFGMSDSCPFWILRAGTSPTTRHFTLRRERRFLLPSSPDNKFMQIPTLELLMRTGIGLTPGDAADPPVLGSDPQVMMRISKDGGQTWLPERWVSAGTIGKYLTRARWLQATGNYRNAVCEITVSDPVDFQFLAMEGTPKEGTS